MRRRRAYAAACAVVLLVVGQLVALAHQAGTRHVTCDEHGEQLEAATLVERLHACEHDHLIGIEGDAGEHDDCVLLRGLHQSAQTSTYIVAPTLVPFVTTNDAPPSIAVAATTALYLIAPKTSPPALA